MRFTWNVSRAVCLLIAIRLWKALPCLLSPPTLPSSAQLRPTFKRRVVKGDYKATRVILQPYKVKSSASDRRLRFLTWLLQAILHGAWPYLRAVVYITGVCFVILDCPRTGLAIEKKKKCRAVFRQSKTTNWSAHERSSPSAWKRCRANNYNCGDTSKKQASNNHQAGTGEKQASAYVKVLKHSVEIIPIVMAT